MRASEIISACWSDIDTAGYVVVAMEGEWTPCDWAYTIGLHQSVGHPELIIVGIEAAMAGGVLAALSEQILRGAAFEPGGTATVGPLRCGIRRVDEPWLTGGDWFKLGRTVLARKDLPWPPTLQVVWSDAVGEYPEYPGDPRWMLRQPLLVER
jgi:hypothetical protein